tara:strand:- start:245 stop:1306 length:1062 start_codon:yes stop_codon:yes gene_type:complete
MVSTTEKNDSDVQESVSMKALLEAGVHFGHQTQRWHPRMKQYIFTQRNGIHIIDLQQTLGLLENACKFISKIAEEGKSILFVGTKRQAQDAVQQAAHNSDMFFVSHRWLGGMLTNFSTIQARIDYLVRLEERKAKGGFNLLTKKEALKLEDEIQRLTRNFGGVKEMTKLPGALFVVDIAREKIAVAEARRMGIPIVALVDTDGDPDLVDYVIPGNDDAIRSIALIAGRIASAALEGFGMRVQEVADMVEPTNIDQVAESDPEDATTQAIEADTSAEIEVATASGSELNEPQIGADTEPESSVIEGTTGAPIGGLNAESEPSVPGGSSDTVDVENFESDASKAEDTPEPEGASQ